MEVVSPSQAVNQPLWKVYKTVDVCGNKAYLQVFGGAVGVRPILHPRAPTGFWRVVPIASDPASFIHARWNSAAKVRPQALRWYEVF